MSLVALVATLSSATPAPVRADEVRGAPEPAAVPDGARRMPVLSVPGAPRSLVFVMVPVPSELAVAGRIRFVVRVAGGHEVIGALNGEVLRDSTGAPRPIFLSVRVPSDAEVGLTDVAEVEFAHANGTVLVVPVSIRVLATYGVTLEGPPEVRDLERGDRIALTYRLTNTGNVPETFALTLAAPEGWGINTSEQRTVSVAAYGTAELDVNMRVPAFLGAGSYGLEVVLRRSGEDSVLARRRTGLRVREEVVAREGLVMQPFVAMTATGNGAGLGSGLEVFGPVMPGVRLRATVTPFVPRGAQEAFALANVGAMRMPLQASLEADKWSALVGTTQVAFSELTGLNAAGQGVLGTLRNAGREYRAIAAVPVGAGTSRGRVLGASMLTEIEAGTVVASATMLEDASAAGFATRRLTAFGADWTSNSLGAAQLNGGIAVRGYGDGARLGFRAGLLQEREGQRVSFSYLHAPGGSQAFAAATTAIAVDARRRLTERVEADASFNVTTDVTGVFREIRAQNASAAARYRLSDATTFGARLGTQRLDAVGSTAGFGGFGTNASGVSLTGSTARRDWNFGADLGFNRVERSTELLSGSTSAVLAGQANLSLSASRMFEQWGSVSLGTNFTRTGAGVGTPTALNSGYARWSSVPLVIRRQVWRVDNEASVLKTSLDRARFGLRTGVSTTWRSGLSMQASMERNPFVVDRSGRAGWIAALRITVSTEVRATERLQATGIVYRDANANGRRDDGEAGVPNVTLRFDNMRIVTGRDGSYRLPASLRGRLRVDASSLPSGVVAHPRLAVDSLERRDIPLVPTGTRTVILAVQADGDGRTPDVDIDQAEVWLRDAEGFEWVGRGVGGGRFVFEHIPVGMYFLRLDFDKLTEPMRADDTSIRFESGAGEDVVVPVRGRTIRLITPPRGGGRSGTRGGASSRFAPRGSE